MFRHLRIATAVLSLWAMASATSWGQQPLFDEITHDFGSAPRGTTLSHQFKLTNTTKNPLHVSGLRTSCICSSAQIGKNDLQPGESTFVTATIDTKKYSGTRTFTIYVNFDRPFVDEARLVASATSREDVQLEPGELQFGHIKKGTPAKASLTVRAYNAGFQVTGVDNDNGYILPTVTTVQTGAGQAYQLDVKLREDVPVGAWHAELWLKTNDATTPRIRVPLVVEIEGTLTATPSEVALGQVKAGNKVERKVVIRSTTPFKVTKIEGTDEDVQVSGGNEEEKNVQVLKVTCNANAKASDLKRTIKVNTSLAGESVEFTLQGTVTQ